MRRALGMARRVLEAASQLDLGLLPQLLPPTRPGRPPQETGRGGPPPNTESTPQARPDPHRFIASPITTSLVTPLVVPPSRPTSDAAFLQQLQALGLRGIRHCTLTRNRSTLVSFQRDQLRVHRAMVQAPSEVHRAIVDFVNGPPTARRTARQVLVRFEVPSEFRVPRRRHPEAPRPDDARLIARLTEAHQRFNHARFGGALSTIGIRISRKMRSRLGHYSPGTEGDAPEIAIGRRHLRRDGWASACDTLLHEMVHQWQHESGRPLAHDRAFRRKAREVGIATSARRDAGRAT